MKGISKEKLDIVRKGAVIPASPLAVTADRKFDKRRQEALMRYYVDSGAGGVAVGMHFTQFEINNPGINLYEPVLSACACALDDFAGKRKKTIVKIAGFNGSTEKARKQAEIAVKLGYDFGIVSMGSFKGAMLQDMVYHIKELSRIIPLFGFYLLTGVGGVVLPYRFWREIVEIDNVYGIKIAPFNRYFTLDVCRAVVDAGKEDKITLYTGNDESIVHDLLTPFRFVVNGKEKTVRIKGGILGFWACWTSKAVELLNEIHRLVDENRSIPPELLTLAAQLTDANAALFDPIHDYAGSIPGVNEILRRQGIMENNHTLKYDEVLSPGQLAEIDRVTKAYPHLQDDAFVEKNLHKWLKA